MRTATCVFWSLLCLQCLESWDTLPSFCIRAGVAKLEGKENGSFKQTAGGNAVQNQLSGKPIWLDSLFHAYPKDIISDADKYLEQASADLSIKSQIIRS